MKVTATCGYIYWSKFSSHSLLIFHLISLQVLRLRLMFSDVFHYITDTVCYMYMSKRLTSELTSLKSTSEPNLQSHRAQLKHFFPQITFSTFISSLRLVFSTSFHYRTFIRTRLFCQQLFFLPATNFLRSRENPINSKYMFFPVFHFASTENLTEIFAGWRGYKRKM